MLIGKIVGTVIATRKDEKMEGLKFLVLKQINVEAQEGSGYVVAADAVGAKPRRAAATWSPRTRWARAWANTCSMPAAHRPARPSSQTNALATP